MLVVLLYLSLKTIINLSYQLSQQEESLLNHGFNFNVKSKINPVRNTVAILFTRIVLKHLDNGQRIVFRKAEKISKQYIKIKFDVKHLNFCSVSQILPKFTGLVH